MHDQGDDPKPEALIETNGNSRRRPAGDGVAETGDRSGLRRQSEPRTAQEGDTDGARNEERHGIELQSEKHAKEDVDDEEGADAAIARVGKCRKASLEVGIPVG